MDDRFAARADAIADQERAIQRDIDAKDQQSGGDPSSGAVQAGARPYP
ncbi:short-chain dehydrogenase, partial [Pseudomonas sp. ODNR1LW]|nr:short-chain dehydrogenase [Pseudomonas sp. ODNR1LW]